MAKRTKQIEAERPRGGHARSVAEMVPQIGATAFRKFGFVQSAVVTRWAEIVGQRYAEVSVPESIRFPHNKRGEGVLTLTVASAHAPMMQHVEPAIIERVNRFFGYAAVVRVVMRQGAVPAARQRPRAAPLTVVPVELGESLRTVGDPELKAVLEALARGVAAATTAIPVLGKVS